MQRQQTRSIRQRCALAMLLLPAAGLVVVVGQVAVSMRASAPPPVQSQSVRYGGGTLLPSEQRYVRAQSGLMGSELRDAQWGSLPSQGRISASPATLRYSSYNSYYNRTADSLAPATGTYSRQFRSSTSAASIRYNLGNQGNTYKTRAPSHTYSFRQNYNSYTQVSNPNKYTSSYKPPSVRYGR
jgi:hypothetical protein